VAAVAATNTPASQVYVSWVNEGVLIIPIAVQLVVVAAAVVVAAVAAAGEAVVGLRIPRSQVPVAAAAGAGAR